MPFLSLFFCSPKITQPRPQIFSVNGSITCSRLHFWHHFEHHWFNMTKLLMWSVQYDNVFSKFGQQWLVNYTCGFNQSEMGKNFFGMNNVKYTTTFLQCEWLYFPWHCIKTNRQQWEKNSKYEPPERFKGVLHVNELLTLASSVISSYESQAHM